MEKGWPYDSGDTGEPQTLNPEGTCLFKDLLWDPEPQNLFGYPYYLSYY